ncbi:hypothetical protein [Aridibaculum aurantiacum]|uniref:hypothetical protein n=1 Tax=Aridibaculum aurantiacum TaxID=2810307 RepID=UPI001A959D5C|nr:hypothetical protein [Aridibaculum aurantiacum]
MEQVYDFAEVNEQQAWQQIADDIETAGFDFLAVIKQHELSVILKIMIDPGGGFEGGYAVTTLLAKINPQPFRFTFYEQGIVAEVGKFLGMEDVETGFADFDKKVIVKTNDAEKVKALVSDAAVREVVQDLQDFNFTISEEGEDELILRLEIEEGITDIHQLQQLYKTIVAVLQKLNAY